MGLFSKLFDDKKQDKQNRSYVGRLSIVLVYKDPIGDSDEEIDRWIEQGDDERFWNYQSVGETGPTGLDTAKRDRMPVPISYDYPIYFVYESPASMEDYQNPLFYSTNQDEVIQFIEQYEESFQEE